jgi:hypothetical protein
VAHISRPDGGREPEWTVFRVKFDVGLENIDIMVQADFTSV